MFKRTLAFALLVSSSTFAADLLDTPTDNTFATGWSGLRGSVFGGLSHSNGRARLADFSGVLIPLDVNNGLFPRSIDGDELGSIVGVGIGYDQQFGNWVGGIAIDGTLNTLEVDRGHSRIDPNPVFPFTGVSTNTSFHTNLDWLVTARVRLGYAFRDDLMVYGTGGFAIGDVTNRFTLNIPNFPLGAYTSPDWSESGTETGFVVGAGIEKKLTENLTLTFSLEYVDLGDVNVEGVDPANFPGEEINYSFDNTFTIAKIGLTTSF